VRQSRTGVWKSCIVDVVLMEEEVEELALRLPYPLMETLEYCRVEASRRGEDTVCEGSKVDVSAEQLHGEMWLVVECGMWWIVAVSNWLSSLGWMCSFTQMTQRRGEVWKAATTMSSSSFKGTRSEGRGR